MGTIETVEGSLLVYDWVTSWLVAVYWIVVRRRAQSLYERFSPEENPEVDEGHNLEEEIGIKGYRLRRRLRLGLGISGAKNFMNASSKVVTRRGSNINNAMSHFSTFKNITEGALVGCSDANGKAVYEMLLV